MRSSLRLSIRRIRVSYLQAVQELGVQQSQLRNWLEALQDG